MKKIPFLMIIGLMIVANSCQNEEAQPAPKYSSKELEKFTSFNDWDEFVKTAIDLDKKSVEEVRIWEKQQNFLSLKSIYEQTIEEEEIFLQDMVKKFGENATLTRKDFGYAPLSTELIERHALYADENEILNMNVTVPYYANVVNADGIVKIGKQIFQFKSDAVKSIIDGDEGKISLLAGTTASNQAAGISVEAVERSRTTLSDDKDNARTKYATSCTSTVGSYRLITYEEKIGSPTTSWCGATSGKNHYIQLRSLKKILGTWQNHNTNFLHVVSNNVHIALWWLPKEQMYRDLEGTGTIQVLFADEVGVDHALPYGHTEEHYYVQNFPMKCFLPPNTNTTCSVLYSKITDITGMGKDGTQCNVGRLYSMYNWDDCF